MNQPPAAPMTSAPMRTPAASMATYKRELRKEIRRRAFEPEINFLNITAMLDMMTIILVFLLKSMSASNLSLPQSGDLVLPRSVLTTESAEPEGLVIMISKTKVTVGNSAVVEVPQDSKMYGLAGKDKRGSRNDFYVVPLANALQAWRDVDKRVRAATGKDVNASEAVIVADAETPYRVLTEVLFTLGQTEFAKFHMMVLQGSKTGK